MSNIRTLDTSVEKLHFHEAPLYKENLRMTEMKWWINSQPSESSDIKFKLCACYMIAMPSDMYISTRDVITSWNMHQ